MRCQDCPYGFDDFQRLIKIQSNPDDIERFIWCDKVGGKIYQLGYCGEHNAMIPKDVKHNRSNKAKSNKYNRDKKI